VVAGIVVDLPFCARPVCLPVLARLWRPRRTGKIAFAREMVEAIAARHPDRAVHAVGDAAYAGEHLRRLGTAITWDQPAQGHLGSARAGAAADRALGPAAHPGRSAGYPGRPRRRRGLAHRPGPSLRADRVRADHRDHLPVVRVVPHRDRAGHSGS
jgi:hypothetical protein